jgi:hypothetical protein
LTEQIRIKDKFKIILYTTRLRNKYINFNSIQLVIEAIYLNTFFPNLEVIQLTLLKDLAQISLPAYWDYLWYYGGQ